MPTDFQTFSFVVEHLKQKPKCVSKEYVNTVLLLEWKHFVEHLLAL